MSRIFTSASDSVLQNMICSAKTRLVLISPGLPLAVANTLVDRIKTNGAPSTLAVIVDTDPEVCRLGYGEIESIDVLNEALQTRGYRVQMQAGIRIGVIIADEEILIFSPTPRLIEAESHSESTPNAIRITPSASMDIAQACGAAELDLFITHQEVGLDFVNEDELAETKRALKEVPPRKFDLARLERVFNYRLEFVEFAVENYKLNFRSVPLPPELLGLEEENLQERFRNTFRIFEGGTPFEFEVEDPNNSERKLKLTEKWISEKADNIRKKYFISLGSKSYGNLILKRLKPDFLYEVGTLRKLLNLYAEKVSEAISDKIKETRASLIEALLPRVTTAPPKAWTNRSVDGSLCPESTQEFLERAINIAFHKANDEFRPNIICLFKSVTYETICEDERFQERIKLHFGEEEAKKLFTEYDASRAQDE